MKRFRSRADVAVLFLGLLAGNANAQRRPAAAEATLFLLLPVGARAPGMGNATAAASGTTEGIFWNPAGLATIGKREVALNHSQSVIGTGDAVALAFRSRLGVTGVAGNVLDYGGGDVTGPDSVPSGQLFPRNVAVVVSHGARVGKGLRIGASYKYLQFRFDCSGECPAVPSTLSSTSAFDLGLQYDLQLGLPIQLGVAFRNMGLRLATSSEGDDQPVPSQIQVGALVRYAVPKTVANDAVVSLAVDVIDRLEVRRPLPRVGGEFVWEGTVSVRGGYVFEERGTESGEASLGIGFSVRRLTIDFARNFSGLSADAGQPPAFLSLRVGF